MDAERVCVRNVRGRFPQEPVRLDSDEIETQVVEESRLITIRLDHREHADFWMEITIQLEGGAAG